MLHSTRDNEMIEITAIVVMVIIVGIANEGQVSTSG